MKNNSKKLLIAEFKNYSFTNLKTIFGGQSDPDDDDIEKGSIKVPTNGNSEEEDDGE